MVRYYHTRLSSPGAVAKPFVRLARPSEKNKAERTLRNLANAKRVTRTAPLLVFALLLASAMGTSSVQAGVLDIDFETLSPTLNEKSFHALMVDGYRR